MVIISIKKGFSQSQLTIGYGSACPSYLAAAYYVLLAGAGMLSSQWK